MTESSVRMVTIADVARASGVSSRTVSRVLNASPKVDDRTRAVVQDAIDAVGFTANERARALAAGRSRLIAMVQDDTSWQVIGVLQRHIVEICHQQGYELVVHPVDFDDPDLATKITSFARRSRVDGLIVLPPVSQIEAIPRHLTALGTPCVGVASVAISHYPFMVIGNERKAASDLARHLVELGHRRFAIIEGPPHFRSAQERRTGFCAALANYGDAITVQSRPGDYGFDSGLRAAASLLDSADRPTAIFACNDTMAAAAIRAALERGLSLPDHLSVAGFDDSDLASMIFPSLTSVRRPLRETAQTAVEALFKLIDQPGLSLSHPVLDLSLTLRHSTGAPDRAR